MGGVEEDICALDADLLDRSPQACHEAHYTTQSRIRPQPHVRWSKS